MLSNLEDTSLPKLSNVLAGCTLGGIGYLIVRNFYQFSQRPSTSSPSAVETMQNSPSQVILLQLESSLPLSPFVHPYLLPTITSNNTNLPSLAKLHSKYKG
jgi:hypothetical protein